MEKSIPYYQINSFTDRMNGGNPAGVCPLTEWLDELIMQKIAFENNLSETAFFVGQNGQYDLRWFTPTIEVNLCGHATLAAAYVINRELGDHSTELRFQTKSGELVVTVEEDLFHMSLPSYPPEVVTEPDGLVEALGGEPEEILFGDEDYFVRYSSEDQIKALSPDFAKLSKIKSRGAIVTAPAEGNIDFVSRWFGPNVGVNEDPVTGSAHCILAPYWASKLGKGELVALQLSERLGEIWCKIEGDRVRVSGKGVKYLEGKIFL